MDIDGSYNTILGNRIIGANRGIETRGSSNTFYANNVTNAWAGMFILSSTYNNISGNDLFHNGEYGMYVGESNNDNNISANNFESSKYGIMFAGSSKNNLYSENNIADNTLSGVIFQRGISSGNIFFHNNFVANTVQVSVGSPGFVNTWDNGNITGGNYWSNYHGVDFNGDGFGDTPYSIDSNNKDNYPLMIEALSFFHISHSSLKRLNLESLLIRVPTILKQASMP